MFVTKQNTFPVDFIPDVVLFHNAVANFPCPDGLAAAWVCYRKFCIDMSVENIRFIGCGYDEAPPNIVAFDNILVVDFSFDLETLETWEMMGKTVYTIDHHEGFEQKLDAAIKTGAYSFQPNILNNIFLDMEESGATLTYKLLYPGEEVPVFLQYVRDRDLGLDQLPWTDHVHAGSGRIRRSFSLYDQLCVLDQDLLIDYLKPEGEISLSKKYADIKLYLDPKPEKCRSKKPNQFYLWQSQNIDSLVIPVVMLNSGDMQLKCDISKFILHRYPFTPFCVILDKKDSYKIRIRSSKYTHNVNLVKLFADLTPGGHAPAANFNWEGSQQDLIGVILSHAESWWNANMGDKSELNSFLTVV